MPTTDSRYPQMQFPDYEFQEYPKYLGVDKYGNHVIANDEEHEDEIVDYVIDTTPKEEVKSQETKTDVKTDKPKDTFGPAGK